MRTTTLFAVLIMVFGSLSAYGVQMQPFPDEEAVFPATASVVGGLEVPYSGPLNVILDGDAIIVNPGGNIGPFGIVFANSQVIEESLYLTGDGLLSYDEDTGIFAIAIGEDFEFEMAIQARSAVPPIILDNDDCPENRKCCECEGKNGGRATAVCMEDERPICTCSPCCRGTCVKMKTEVEGIPNE